MATATQSATINARSLGVAIGRVMGAVHVRGPKPILSNVLLEIGEQCSVSATNLECFMRAKFNGDGDLRVCVDAMQLSKIAGLCGDSLLVEVVKDSLSLVGDRARWTLGTMPADEFPKPPDVAGDPISVSSVSLREAIRHVVFAADRETARYALGGIKFEFSEGDLYCIGTDGRRLASVSVPATGFGDALIPFQFAEKLLASLPDEGECQVLIVPSWLGVTTDRLEFSCLQTEARFPRWRDVIPSMLWPLFECPASSLLATLRSVFVVDEGRDYLASDWRVTLDGVEVLRNRLCWSPINTVTSLCRLPRKQSQWNDLPENENRIPESSCAA
jgi:DNA polymerase-3 subunit beta